MDATPVGALKVTELPEQNVVDPDTVSIANAVLLACGVTVYDAEVLCVY
jgi:hypothetical protein